MAIPVIASSSTQTIGSQTTSATISPPSGLGAGNLDVILVVAKTQSTGKTIAVPSDYTQIVQAADASNTRFIVAAFWRAAEASPGDAVINLSDSANIDRAGIERLRITGADLSSPINVSAGALASGSANPGDNPTFTRPGITTTVDDCLAISMLVWGSSYITGPPRYTVADWTTLGTNSVIASGGSASHISACFAAKGVPAAGATGNAVFDPGDHANTTDQPWSAHMFAIAPGEGGPAPSIVRPRVVMF